MNNDLISKLRPWVTTFSEAIRYQHQHKDELRVGGKIVRIFNFSSMTQDKKDMVYLTVDDDVGEISLMVPGDIYEELDNKYSFVKGMIVLADGKLLDPEDAFKKPIKSTKLKRSELVEATPSATLICWNIEPYKECVIPET